jgi:glycosyltransferase involved in cell wall biosynthesis
MTQYDLIVVNDFAHINGGAGYVALTSAMGLAERGHSVTIFSAVAPAMAQLEEKKIKLICTNQHQILDDPNRLRAVRQGIWNSTAAQRMRKLLTDFDPSRTIVHLHGWTKSLSSSVIHEATASGFQVVCTLHDYFIACPNGGFYNFRKNQVCQIRPLSTACILSNCDKHGYHHKLWRMCRQTVQKNLCHVPTGIRHFVSISDFSRKILDPFLPSEANVYDVPNPIFVEKDEPARPEENRVFTAVGRLNPEKGLSLFAEAAKQAKCPIMFVGDGECRSELEKVFPDATITGWISQEDVQKHIRTARALVLPSLWYETQGMVVLEAAAAGVPAIVPEKCAAGDFVINGETGLWFKSGDRGDLAAKIGMLKDNQTAKRMGQRAYEHFWSNPPTLKRHVSCLEEVYSQVLEDRGHPLASTAHEYPDLSDTSV